MLQLTSQSVPSQLCGCKSMGLGKGRASQYLYNDTWIAWLGTVGPVVDCYHSLLRMKPNAVFLQLFINSCCRMGVDVYQGSVCVKYSTCMYLYTVCTVLYERQTCVSEKNKLIGVLNKTVTIYPAACFRPERRAQFTDDVRRRERSSDSVRESNFTNRLCRLSQEANTMASTNASQHQDSK